MQLALEKILDRAEQRLRKLPEAGAEETLSLLRGYLRMESHRLRMLHRYGLGGLELAAMRSQVVDALIIHVYRVARERQSRKRPLVDTDSSAAVVAVGGYGRSELCPQSDIDVLILYDRSAAEFGRVLARELFYLLWDTGLKVGHSYRTVEQSLELARTDSSVENSLLDARHLAGSRKLFEKLQEQLRQYWSRSPRQFAERKQREVQERYGKLGESVLLLEPNVKESPGGLRDFHVLGWLARGAWGLRTAAQLSPAVLSGGDWQRAFRGLDWLLRVRNELHYETGRRADQLTFALQPETARALRFAPQKHQLAAEVFMRHYFQHAENIHRAMRQVLSAALRERGRKGRRVLVKMPGGLSLARSNGQLRLIGAGDRRFSASPPDMMRIFALVQESHLQPGEDIQSAVRENLRTVSRRWQRDTEMSRLFLKMLRQPGSVATALRPMHSAGLLGKFLPEFGRITRLMQYDYYHRYTTDEHTLRAVELLDGIWGQTPPAMLRYRELTYHISDHAPLYLGLLLHDAGKGLGGGHSEKGALRAAAVCERLGLAERQARQVVLLVRHHLLLSHLSQRRDLSDRRVARQAAELLGDLETLSMLTLLTFADTAAVAPEIWTDWKNELLWELYERVHMEFLGLEAATAQEEQRLRAMRAEIEQLLHALREPALGAPPESPQVARLWMDGHLSLLPRRYPLGARPELIARQILLARRAAGSPPAVFLIPSPEQGCTVLLLCCPDTQGLFARIAGTLAALEINILRARLDTRRDGMAVDMLWISTPRGDAIDDPHRLRRISTMLEAVLGGRQPFEEIVSRIDARPLAPALKTPKLSLNNEISESCTVLEVLAEDRLGFAYSVAKCLSALGLSIQLAKLATEKTMAFDVFYLTASGGSKIPESQWEQILFDLKAALLLPSASLPTTVR